MTPFEKAVQALGHHTKFNGFDLDDCCLFIDGPDGVMYELPHDNGQFNLSDFRALINTISARGDIK